MYFEHKKDLSKYEKEYNKIINSETYINDFGDDIPKFDSVREFMHEVTSGNAIKNYLVNSGLFDDMAKLIHSEISNYEIPKSEQNNNQSASSLTEFKNDIFEIKKGESENTYTLNNLEDGTSFMFESNSNNILDLIQEMYPDTEEMNKQYLANLLNGDKTLLEGFINDLKCRQ